LADWQIFDCRLLPELAPELAPYSADFNLSSNSELGESQVHVCMRKNLEAETL
jgi:hypothetical protein